MFGAQHSHLIDALQTRAQSLGKIGSGKGTFTRATSEQLHVTACHSWLHQSINDNRNNSYGG